MVASRAAQLRMPREQISGAHGTRNVRGNSGRVWRRIHTPAQTAMKAIRVPIETRSPNTSSGKMAASNAMPAPVISVFRCGVR